MRRRFKSAISRLTKTYEQGYWESVVVDLIIVMGSLLTPNKQGGRMQLASLDLTFLGQIKVKPEKFSRTLSLCINSEIRVYMESLGHRFPGIKEFFK